MQRLFDELIALPSVARESRISELTLPAAISAEVRSLLVAADRTGDFLGVLSVPTPLARSVREPDSVIAGRYRIEREIGRGAMGVVYQAHDQQLDRRIALKFLETAGAPDARTIRRFMTEARAAARLDHPNVAAVHDIVEMPDGQLFIAMSYCSGETLRDRILRGPIEPPDALRLAAQIASALAAAYAAGIVHRDVKPANVIFDTPGTVKLTDFGVAKLSGDHEVSSPGITVGTIAYMSPEQIRGDSVDHRTDLWSLGVVLYEMLAGCRPFSSDHVASVMHAVLESDPVSLPGDPRITQGVRDLVDSLLAKRPENRPANAIIVGDILARLIPGDDRVVIGLREDVAAGALPSDVTSFVGREREIEIAGQLLHANRLLTLTGPGGTGKTRLATQLAHSMRSEFPDGIWFIALAEVADADLVPTLTAQELGLRDLGGGRLSSRVVTALRSRHALLVLDNFEHVLGAAPFVSELLAGCPELTILVTSRTPLSIQGEQEFPVPPLVTPASDDDAAGESEAVRLFVQRARAVRPDFALNDEIIATVAEICRRLDGLPLALELAAARAKLLSPRAMLSRLEHRFDLLRRETAERPSRHGTMRDVIDWSYVLLTESERTLFDRLTVFAGGISVEAARAVSPIKQSDAASAFALLDTLGSLCNKSLLRQEEEEDGEPRFMMLETVREFGLDQLRATGGEPPARRAHTAYYLALAENGAAQLRGPTQAAWLDRFDTEYANLRIALDSAIADAASGYGTGLADAARLALALYRLWMTRGPLLEGVEYLRRIIALADAAGRDSSTTALDFKLHARLLTASAQLANTRSVFIEARDLFERSLELQRRADDLPGIATTLNNLGWTVWIIGDLARGEELSRSAMRMHEARGDDLGVSLSLNNLAWIAMERGEYQRAEEHFARVVEAHRLRGDPRTVAFALGWVGVLATRRRDYSRAIALHEAAIEMLEPVAERAYRSLSFVRLEAARHAAGLPGTHSKAVESLYLRPLWDEGRLWPIAFALTELGRMLHDEDALESARSRLIEALDVRSRTGALHGVAEARLLLGSVYTRLADPIRAGESLQQALREATTFGATPIIIDCIETIATLLLESGNHESAAVLFAAVDAQRNTLGVFHAVRYKTEDEVLRSRVESNLSHDALLHARNEGAALSVDEAREAAFNALLHL